MLGEEPMSLSRIPNFNASVAELDAWILQVIEAESLGPQEDIVMRDV
jgi:hypothetical protein